jgi:ribonuclease E
MTKTILIDAAYPDLTQVALIENNKLVDLESSTNSKKIIKGNIYLAKVTRVEPSLQAAFIDYGSEKNGFIPFAEIHSDYYNVPSKYRKDLDLLEEEQNDTTESDQDYTGLDLEEQNNFEPDLDNIIEEILTDTQNDSADENDIEKIKKANTEKYKIQEVIRRNQIILVQAVKEERGNKGASFTSYISLAGRYCVIMPNSGSKGGISKKIEDQEERKRLKSISDEISATNPLGVIIRTVGQGKSRENIEKDYNYLIKLWNEIREKTLVSNAPAFIHSEENIFKRIIRDLYDNYVDSIIIEGKVSYQEMIETAQSMSSEDEINIIHYNEKVPIFNKYKVDEQIISLYSPVAYTESGAYIVINPTEALTSIDVNSGKSTTEKNIEKTALKTNLEAAKEIVRQIRLRDISGIIVIDFIDMAESRNKKLVEKTFRDLLYKDKAKVQVGHISNLGLLEVSRQRLRPNFLESNTITCPHCNGKGAIRSNESNAVMILKTIEGEVSSTASIVNVFTAPETAMFILNHSREALKTVEQKHNIQIIFQQDPKFTADGFALEVIEEKTANATKKNLADKATGEIQPKQLNDKKNRNNRRRRQHKPKKKTNDTESNSLPQDPSE